MSLWIARYSNWNLCTQAYFAYTIRLRILPVTHKLSLIKQFFCREFLFEQKWFNFCQLYQISIFIKKVIVFVQCPITNIVINFLVYEYQPVITYISFDESFDATKLVLCQFEHLFEVLQFFGFYFERSNL